MADLETVVDGALITLQTGVIPSKGVYRLCFSDVQEENRNLVFFLVLNLKILL